MKRHMQRGDERREAEKPDMEVAEDVVDSGKVDLSDTCPCHWVCNAEIDKTRHTLPSDFV